MFIAKLLFARARVGSSSAAACVAILFLAAFAPPAEAQNSVFTNSAASVLNGNTTVASDDNTGPDAPVSSSAALTTFSTLVGAAASSVDVPNGQIGAHCFNYGIDTFPAIPNALASGTGGLTTTIDTVEIQSPTLTAGTPVIFRVTASVSWLKLLVDQTAGDASSEADAPGSGFSILLTSKAPDSADIAMKFWEIAVTNNAIVGNHTDVIEVNAEVGGSVVMGISLDCHTQISLESYQDPSTMAVTNLSAYAEVAMGMALGMEAEPVTLMPGRGLGDIELVSQLAAATAPLTSNATQNNAEGAIPDHPALDCADPDSTPCDDFNACTTGETCQSNRCTGGSVSQSCPAPNACHETGICNPLTGSSCVDVERACFPLDQCHEAGVCELPGGQCSDPPIADGTACDDLDLCTFLEECTAGVCGNGIPESTPECQNGGIQDKDQQACLNALNKAGSKVFRAQTKLSQSCAKAAAKGKEANAETCLSADTAGKVASAKAAVADADLDKCALTPATLGYTDPTTVGDGAADAEVDLVHRIFGSDLSTPIPQGGTDKATDKCQQSVQKAYGKLADAKIKIFLACKKSGLKNETIITNQTLSDCFDTILADAKGKIAKRKTKLFDTLSSKCATVTTDSAFPGACVGTSGTALEGCLDAAVECAVCEMFNSMDGLSRDCDVFDDGVTNTSCP